VTAWVAAAAVIDSETERS